MLFTAVLYVATGVGGYEWPIYARAFCMDVAFWQFSNNLPNYSSMADAIDVNYWVITLILKKYGNLPFFLENFA